MNVTDEQRRRFGNAMAILKAKVAALESGELTLDQLDSYVWTVDVEPPDARVREGGGRRRVVVDQSLRPHKDDS